MLFHYCPGAHSQHQPQSRGMGHNAPKHVLPPKSSSPDGATVALCDNKVGHKASTNQSKAARRFCKKINPSIHRTSNFVLHRIL